MPSKADIDDQDGDEVGADSELSTFGGPPGEQVRLDLIHDKVGDALLYLFAEPTDEEIADGRVTQGKLLARFHRRTDVLETFPLRSFPHEHGFLEPKHGGLVRIVFEDFGFGVDVPKSAGEAVDAFMALPEGFVKQYQYGLGIYRKNIAIADAVEAIPGVDTLVVQRGSREAPLVVQPQLILSKDRFDAMRRALERITVNYRSEALADKRLLVHNELLHVVDPQLFPTKPPRYKPNVVYRIVQAAAATTLSNEDQKAALQLVAGHKEAIAATQPKLAMRLKNELELVTLGVLIDRFRAMLEQPHSELAWQAFFTDHAFVLSMAFGYPVVKIGEQIAVGGTRFLGGGTKYADFAVRHASTGNLVIVEIKRPSTSLLARKEYRGGVYPWSPEMTGGIQQVLDQRYQLQRNITTLKDDSDLPDVQGYAVDCVLIAGTLTQLSDKSRQKSFEIARRSVHGVLVVTFDELLGKLEALQSALGEGLADGSRPHEDAPRVVAPAPPGARVPTVTQAPRPTGSATRPLPSAKTGSAIAPTSHEPD